MIKATELRIGNYVKSHEGAILKVYGVTNDERGAIMWYDNEMGFYEKLDLMEPILLTPEILEKAGYTLQSSDKLVEEYEFNDCWLNYFKKNSDGYNPMHQSKSGGLIIGNTIRHLHQLQNLYFALAGEELNIDL